MSCKANVRNGITDQEFKLAYYKACDAQKNNCFNKSCREQMFSQPPVYDSWPGGLEGCGSSSAGSSSSSLPSGWKSMVVQSIPVKALNTASSLISGEGSTSGA